jgi:hypothetical protein
MKKYYVRCGQILRVGLAESPHQAAEVVMRSNLNSVYSKTDVGTTIYVTQHGFKVFRDKNKSKGHNVWRFRTIAILRKIQETP